MSHCYDAILNFEEVVLRGAGRHELDVLLQKRLPLYMKRPLFVVVVDELGLDSLDTITRIGEERRMEQVLSAQGIPAMGHRAIGRVA